MSKVIRIQKADMNGMGGFDFCRHLLAQGESADAILEVYRQDTLAYRIKPLKWGAGKSIYETSVGGGPYVVDYRPMSEETKQKLRNGR